MVFALTVSLSALAQQVTVKGTVVNASDQEPVVGATVAGKGTGISEMIASSMYSSQTGTSIIEKNLDRITIILGIVFFVSLLLLMIIYPH